MPDNQINNQHLLWRAGFGPSADDLAATGSSRPSEWYARLRAASQTEPAYIDAVDDDLRSLVAGAMEGGAMARPEDADTRRLLRERSRQAVKTLNLTWLSQLVASPQQLREKMAFFWHGHFAARNLNVFYQQQLLDVIRRGALGSFRSLLHEVSKSAAMLNFLNAQQNKKDHPNENFAREVMELFTLGRGHYTENDVKEAARAFTGWSANFRGDFVFRRGQHDGGVKTVLGSTGNLEGEAVLDLLLAQKQTARHITRKIYRFFVNEDADEKRVDWLSERFYRNDYNIQGLLDDIFGSTWFFDAKNIGTRIKSPIELLVGMQRMLPMKLANEESLLLVQRVLGQQLFYPPNVAGWPGGRSWIDSSTLMMRMRIPMLLNDQDDFNVRPKSDDDATGGRMEAQPAAQRGGGRVINTHIEWARYTKHFDAVPRPRLLETLTGNLLQTPLRVPATTVLGFVNDSTREAFIRSATLQVMSLPEYQLC
ncbi:MAG: DUF1800 domain-containing protein [Chitinophagaceae bacterium]|nr:MAG: DUF1800 domain-containing protein [Chitinophagaceae bacterium]